MTDARGSQPIRIPLEAKMSSANAQALAETLRENASTPLEIDASQVIMMGAQCFTVLHSAHREWSTNSKAFGVVNPSTEFIEALAYFGVASTHFDAQEV